MTITDDMIGFTPAGRARVWLNPNFAANYPASEELNSLRMNEPALANSMIMRIFQLVEDHTINQSLPAELNNKIVAERPNNFVQAINLLRDYCTEANVMVSSHVSVPSRASRVRSRSVQEAQPTVTKTVTTETFVVPQEQHQQQQQVQYVVSQPPQQEVIVNQAPVLVATFHEPPQMVITPPVV